MKIRAESTTKEAEAEAKVSEDRPNDTAKQSEKDKGEKPFVSAQRSSEAKQS